LAARRRAGSQPLLTAPLPRPAPPAQNLLGMSELQGVPFLVLERFSPYQLLLHLRPLLEARGVVPPLQRLRPILPKRV
jgi:hypothetical protein